MPPPLAIGDVRYVGDTVALVVAESRYAAEDACELVEVEYEPGQAVVDFATAADDTDNLVHAAWGLESNAMVATPFMPISGDLDDAFAAAAHVVECTIEQNRYIAVPMETRGIIASWTRGTRRDGDRVRHAIRARDPQLLRALPRDPGRAASASPRATSAAASVRRCSCSARSARSSSRRACSASR